VYKLTLLGEGSTIDASRSPARHIVVPYNGIPRVEKAYIDGGS